MFNELLSKAIEQVPSIGRVLVQYKPFTHAPWVAIPRWNRSTTSTAALICDLVADPHAARLREREVNGGGGDKARVDEHGGGGDPTKQARVLLDPPYPRPDLGLEFGDERRRWAGIFGCERSDQALCR